MFSIADIDTNSEQQVLDPEDEEGGEAEDEETSPSYPVRTSISITKVICLSLRMLLINLTLMV
jgi:hypothetical protein